MSEYQPFISQIDNIDDILETNQDVVGSKYQNLPMLSLGFHSFINQVREKMNDRQLKERLFYLVVNNFEHKITDYNEDLETFSNNYFNNKSDVNFERSFFKLWEIIFYFDLIQLSDNNFLSANLCENDGSFLRAIMEYRSKFGKSTDLKKDKYCIINKDNNGKANSIISECLIKWKSSIFKLDKNSLNLKDETGNDGGLDNISNIKNYIKLVAKEKKYAKLVTCNGDYNNSNEVELYKLLVGQIITAINIQDKGGNLVVKIFDMYTLPTLKIICILKSLYNEVFVCKPLMSRSFKEEKFLVCKGFKYSQDSKLKKISDKLFNLMEKMNVEENIYDIFTEYNLNEDFIKKITNINLKLSNNQYQMINDITEYKNSGNYFGDAYHRYKDEQIKSTKWWIDTFLAKDGKDLKSNQMKFNNVVSV